MSRSPFRIVVLISGSGTNLQALIDATEAGHIAGQIVQVISNRRGAFGLQRAQKAGIPARVFPLRPYRKQHPDRAAARAAYDVDLAEVIAAAQPDLVVLAGFMLILGPGFLARFPGRVINLHPALPGELPGVDAIARAHAEARAGRRTRTGIMVHYVVEEVDAGPVLGTAEVPIDPAADLEALATAMHAAEHELLVEVVARLAAAHPSA